MNNKKLNILKEHIRFKNGIRIEMHIKLIKSLAQNKNSKPLLRMISQKRLVAHRVSFTKKQLCVISGSFVNINPRLKISRFTIKNLILTRNLDNTSVNAW